MQVYKFGGASTAVPQRMEALAAIIADAPSRLVVVVSAIGKTTNALENIVNTAITDVTAALALADNLLQWHTEYAAILLTGEHRTEALQQIGEIGKELLAAVREKHSSDYNCFYDGVVCFGELLATSIFTKMLLQKGLQAVEIDARTLIATDGNFRDASILWEQTERTITELLTKQLLHGQIVVTQGFIGSAPNGAPVTLGREGSDYTAAILASSLGAEAVTIWKDVAGFLNADPKKFADTRKIDAVSFAEVIEMAFYGAQIIHPKTIKPLQNRNIPLHVKCFLDKTLPGTVITASVPDAVYPPMIVLKENQLLLKITTKDFSFIAEDNLVKIYSVFHQLKCKINIGQNAAISMFACIDYEKEKAAAVVSALQKDYAIEAVGGVSLLTIRHFDAAAVAALTEHKKILLRQETPLTLQMVVENARV
jgi:aspartate kinase